MKTSSHNVARTLLCLASLLAASSGVAEEKDSSVLTTLCSTTISGYGETSVAATFGPLMDSTFLAGVIRDALAQGVIFADTRNEPPVVFTPYPAPLSPIVPVEAAGLPVMRVDVYGPSGAASPFASPVPEPSTITLLVGGAVGLFFATKRRK